MKKQTGISDEVFKHVSLARLELLTKHAALLIKAQTAILEEIRGLRKDLGKRECSPK